MIEPLNHLTQAITLTGKVRVEAVDPITGETTLLFEDHNALTTQFLAFVANAIADNVALTPPLYIELGTGAVAENTPTGANNTLDDTGGSREQIAQGFQVAAIGTISHVLIKLARVGTSAGNLWAEIQTNAAGLPSGTPVANAVSDDVPINGLLTTEGWVLFNFPDPKPVLSAATQYHLVLQTDAGYAYSAAVEEVKFYYDDTAPGYSSGALEYYNGSWAAASPAADLGFRVVVLSDSSFTAVTGAILRKILSSRAVTQTTQARLLANFNLSEAVEYISHVGLFSLVSGAPMYAIATTQFNKGAQQINVYWTIAVSVP